jgi:hypothetical protein
LTGLTGSSGFSGQVAAKAKGIISCLSCKSCQTKKSGCNSLVDFADNRFQITSLHCIFTVKPRANDRGLAPGRKDESGKVESFQAAVPLFT